MNFRLKKEFRYQKTSTEVVSIKPGTYSVPKDFSKELFEKIRRFGQVEVLAEKKAPENKVVKTPENKARVGKKAVRGGRAGSKSK